MIRLLAKRIGIEKASKQRRTAKLNATENLPAKRTWLASYPRSGNTLLRTILHDCFDLVTGSIYDESKGSKDVHALIGLKRNLTPPLIKTHDPPMDDRPAILAVRDGRAAIVSYWHYLIDFDDQQTTLERVITGDVGFGCWSRHYEAWDPERRPNTLLLKFEDFSAQPESAIEAAAAFLNKRPRRPFRKTFDDLRAVDPKFFRSGSNARNIAEMTDAQCRLFAERHGPLMRRLGYFPSLDQKQAPPAA